ncbi:MAG: endonuclease Q family protein [Nanoarchaeota archaeon]|nr:endonuclease Q family protein [Nanoarchaeota archaeon]
MIQPNWMISDLHIHSRFSQACSRNITFENLVKWAKIKGLHLLGTGDFTHPIWFEEIKSKLEDRGEGLYYLDDFPFIISGEISLIYTQERGRRIHLVVLVPSVEVAEKINSYLDTKGRRDYDGRPIFKIPGNEFVREMKKISTEIEIIPAHIWTPWFSVFGSKSGFDSLKECFKEEVDNVYAIETGMSSDPEMNWKIKDLENKSIVSFSDSHSFWPFRLGREATIFRRCDSYREIIKQIRENDFIATIETDPAYGKYHWDGHRACNFSCNPKKSKSLDGICPVCKKPLTIGVEYRVEELSDSGSDHKNKKPFYTLLPLHEIITLALGVSMQSKKVWEVYNNLIKEFDNEFNILLNVQREELVKANVDTLIPKGAQEGTSGKLIALILRNRKGNIKIQPGFDGEYGVAQIGEVEEQKRLF